MITISICDDSAGDARIAKKVIKETLNEIRVSAEIECCYQAADIENKLLKHKEELDILILDIDMPKISGLDLAKKLRIENQDLIIIFLSAHEEFVFKAIEFQPFRYIRKIRLEDEMPLAIRSAVKVIETNKDEQIILNTDDGETRIMISKIMYYETENRKISIHLKTGNHILTNKTMTEMQNMIDKENFIMIHRSCVVNANYVTNMQNCILTLKNNEQLLVSRRKFKEIKQQILTLWGERL
jgi:DNA-binding LytR/AlgR family response regulator